MSLNFYKKEGFLCSFFLFLIFSNQAFSEAMNPTASVNSIEKEKTAEIKDIHELEKKESETPVLTKIFRSPDETIFFFQEDEAVQIKEIFNFPISIGTFDLSIESLPRGLIEDSLLIEIWGKALKKTDVSSTESVSKNAAPQRTLSDSQKPKNAGPIFLKNQIFSNNLLQYQELLDSFVGKQIKIKLNKSASSEEKIISGMFLGLNEKKEPMIFHNQVVDCYPEGYILFPFEKTPKIFPELFLKLENNIHQEAQLILHFLCKNISYHITYLMEIDIIKNEMILQGQMVLKNGSGREFDDVTIYWIDRLVQKKSPSYGQNIKKILLSKKTKIPASGKQTIPFLYKKLQPQITYHAHVPFSLIEAETKEIESKTLPLKRHFSVSSSKLNLKEIPDGNLSVYLKQADQIPIYFLKQKIKSKNSEELQIPLDSHSEIQINVQEVQWRKISEKRKEVTFYILIKNNFSEQTSLYLHQLKKDNLQFLKSHEDPSKNNDDELMWILELPAKSITRFWYRIIVDAQ